ncbi:glycosyltransferase family 2 protein [Candidatus Bathyarchaeota archaeon]|nr:glycosyltransferase family 2 protein [Candidatus Bathyarchaeota archaeon]
MIFTAILLTFFAFTLYNIPVVVTGFWKLWRTRKKETKPVENAGHELPMVSIIIPVKNEEKVVARLLNALTSLNYPSGKKEIIVVNDASTDRTGEICRQYSVSHPEVRVLERASSTTKAGALNFGVNYAHGEVVATFDGDSVPEPDALLKAAGYFEEPLVAGVQGRICSINSEQNMLTRFISYECAVQYELYLQGKDALDLYVGLAGTCQFIRKSALDAVGGWNEDCLGEDTELSVRLIEQGNVIRYASEVRTFEESPFNVKSLLAQRSRWFRGNIEVGLRFGRLMKKPSLRRFDAEMTLFGTFMILLCVVNYFAPFWAFSVPSTLVTTVIAQFTCVFTLFILGLVGVALACMAKPFRLRNVLWLPFIYVYWGFQSFIAMYALLEIALRRKRRWRKTEHSGQVTGRPEERLAAGLR